MFDLDAARAARREAKGDGPSIKFGGETYELPPELPYAALEAMGGLSDDETAPAAIVQVAKALLGDHYPKFVAAEPSADDLNEFMGYVMGEYTQGESSASQGS